MNFSLLSERPAFEKGTIGQSKGFTLIEMMVVILMAVVVLTIASPIVARQLRSIALKNATYQVAGDLNVIKSQAIRTQAVCQVNYDNVNQRYTLTDPNRTVDLTTYRGNVTFAGNPDGGADIFSPTISISARGISALVPPQTTQVYITNRDNRIFRVQVSAAGAVTIREYDSVSGNWI